MEANNKAKDKAESIITTQANWNCHCYCNCPHCEYYIDVLDECHDSWETLPSPGKADYNHNTEYVCPECKKSFIINQIEA